jgi:hypothetical protein
MNGTIVINAVGRDSQVASTSPTETAAFWPRTIEEE